MLINNYISSIISLHGSDSIYTNKLQITMTNYMEQVNVYEIIWCETCCLVASKI